MVCPSPVEEASSVVMKAAWDEQHTSSTRATQGGRLRVGGAAVGRQWCGWRLSAGAGIPVERGVRRTAAQMHSTRDDPGARTASESSGSPCAFSLPHKNRDRVGLHAPDSMRHQPPWKETRVQDTVGSCVDAPSLLTNRAEAHRPTFALAAKRGLSARASRQPE